MADEQHVTVTILGRSYTLRAEEDPQYVRMLAAYVDDKLQEIARLSPRMSTARLAILAAINIADELHKLEDRARSDSDEEAEKVLDRLLKKVSEET